MVKSSVVTLLWGLFAAALLLGGGALLVMLTGCGGPPFTEGFEVSADALGVDAGPPDAAPDSGQDALLDSAGYDGGPEAEAGPVRVTQPEASGPGCWRTPGARTCPTGTRWLAVTCTPDVQDPQVFDTYLECLLVGTGAGTQPLDRNDAGMTVFCCADNAPDH